MPTTASNISARVERITDLRELLKWAKLEMVECAMNYDLGSAETHLTAITFAEIEKELTELETGVEWAET